MDTTKESLPLVDVLEVTGPGAFDADTRVQLKVKIYFQEDIQTPRYCPQQVLCEVAITICEWLEEDQIATASSCCLGTASSCIIEQLLRNWSFWYQ